MVRAVLQAREFDRIKELLLNYSIMDPIDQSKSDLLAIINDLRNQLNATKRQADHVKESSEEFAGNHLIDISPDVYIQFDESNHIRFISNAITGLSGIAPVDVIGKALVDLNFPKSLISIIEDALLMVRKSTNPLRIVHDAEFKSGFKTFELRLFAESESGNEINGVIAILRDITAEKTNGQGESDWKRRYEMIVASSGQVVYDYDIASGEIKWGGSIDSVLGFSAKEMGNIDNWVELIHPDDREMVISMLEKTQETLTPYDVIYRFLHKKGRFVYMHDRGFFIADTSGNAVTMLGMMQDITEQKLAEIALIESEERYRTLFNNTVIGIYLTTIEGKVVMANNELLRMLGYASFEEISVIDVTDSGYADRNYRSYFLEKLSKTDEIKGFESVWRKKNGTFLYVRENAKAIKGTDGKITFIEGTVEDVTNLKFAEEALRESQENLAITLECIGDAVITTDIKGVITRMNLAAEKLTGWPKEEAFGLPVQQVMSLRNSVTREEIASPISRLIKEGKMLVSSQNMEIVSKSNEVYQISHSVAAIRKGEGTIIGAVMVFRDITEKYQQETQVRESEERLRKITDTTSMAIMILQDDYWIFANHAAEMVTGFSKQELFRQHFWEIFHPDMRELAKRRGKQRLQGEDPGVITEYKIIDANGNTKWIDYAANNIEHNGRPAALIIFSDKTERKQIEEALVRSEMNNRATLQAIPDMLFRFDRLGTFLDVYTNNADEFNPPAENLIGQNLSIVFPPEIVKDMLQNISKCLDEGTGSDLESEVEVEGKKVYYETRIVRVSENEVLVLAHNITKRKQAEIDLQNHHQYLTSLLDSIADPLFIKDEDHRWVLVNDAFCRLLGKSREELIGRSDHDFLPKHEADVFWKMDDAVLKTGNENINEEEITDEKGITRHIATKKTLYTRNSGERFVVGIIRDMTDLKKTQERINQMNADLEKRVKERTALLTEIIQQLREEINVRIKTEIERAESEEKFRSLIEQSLDGIGLANSEGKIIEWNKGLELITGYSRESVIGKDQWEIEFELLPSEKKTEWGLRKIQSRWSEILEKKEIPEKYKISEWEIETKDGKKKNIRTTVYAIKAKDSFCIGGIIQDTTASKHAEQALLRSEAQYRNLFENANDAILIFDAETLSIIRGNSKAVDMYGYSFEEFDGKNLHDIARNPDHDTVHLRIMLSTEQPTSYETVHINNQGREMYLLSSGSVVEYNNKKAILNSYRDISQLKKAEKARSAAFQISQLIHSAQSPEQLYRSVHQIVEVLMPARNLYIALYDQETELLTFPYFADEIDKQPAPRRLGRGLTEYVLRNGKPFLAHPELLKNLEDQGEIDLIGSISLDWLGVPLKARDKVIGLIAVQSYSSRIRYSQEEMEMLVFVSEQIAMLINRKQAEDDLFQAKEKAEESDRLKTSLLANMSHELRTPMTGILGFASLLSQEISDPVGKSMAQNILASGKRLMGTLNSILNLSQLEADRSSLKMNITEIAPKIRAVIASLEQSAKQKKLYITSDLTEGICAEIDDNFFIQAISNIIENAIKFTRDGGVNVSSKLMEEDGRKWVMISVKDSGIGITEEHLNIIFKEFRQVSEGHTRTYEGSGLGLSLSKKVIELMNGQISVESKIGEGSEFRIIIPECELKTSTKQVKAETYSNQKPAKTTILLSAGELPKILLVEDNNVNIELTLIYLKKSCRVEFVTDGRSAIDKVRKNRYELILMDINLGPGMSGLDATREIRKIEGNENIPIIALTGYTTYNEKKALLEGGCTHYLAKPFNSASIIKLINTALKSSNEVADT